jgi:hypothetical protein
VSCVVLSPPTAHALDFAATSELSLVSVSFVMESEGWRRRTTAQQRMVFLECFSSLRAKSANRCAFCSTP